MSAQQFRAENLSALSLHLLKSIPVDVESHLVHNRISDLLSLALRPEEIYQS